MFESKLAFEGVGVVTFYFPTEGKRETFIKRHLEGDITSDRLTAIYRGVYHIDGSLLDSIRKYTKIEPRGFKIDINGEIYRCPEEIPLIISVRKNVGS